MVAEDAVRRSKNAEQNQQFSYFAQGLSKKS
jgi:hypothetical protein